MVFRRSKPAEPGPEQHTADIPHQEAFIAWSGDFYELDGAALAQLTPQQRQLQVLARRALWLYADALWDAAKAAGLKPANKAGVYNAIAALRDMGAELYGAATDAQSTAGDDDEDEDQAARAVNPHVTFAPLSEWFTSSDPQ
jgi:hypothetical protein